MGKSVKRLIAIVVSLLIIATSVYVGWRMILADAEHACQASIQQGLQSLTVQELGLGSEIGSEWGIVSDSDSDRLLLLASRVNSLDCHYLTAAGLPIDAWGSHFKLAVRRSSSSNKLEFLIQSNGPDKIANTYDDVSFPPGVRVPRSR